MKGIILAGGEGTRLRPITVATGKQLLPVYDKPMVYYPLSTLIHAGVTDILIVSTPRDLSRFRELFGDGSQFGVKIKVIEQPRPGGIPQGITLAADFLGTDPFWFILGDNLFHGPEFGVKLRECSATQEPTAFAYRVKDSRAYGVAVFEPGTDKVVDLIEKPSSPISSWAIPGLYFFTNSAVGIANGLTASARGELEILDVLRSFLKLGTLNVRKVSRGNAWFDLGTAENMLKASMFVESLQNRQGLLVGSPEEASFTAGNITKSDLKARLSVDTSSEYAKQLLNAISIN
jgi:glucose-1-phosphate thymidylyltransferase